MPDTQRTAPPAQAIHRKVQVWIYRRLEKSPGQGLDRFEILLLLMKPERGGFWQPVTGGVEPDERLDAAALREATEETGLAWTGAPRPLGYEFEFEARGRRFRESVFALEAKEDRREVRLDPHEHVDHKWIPATHAGQDIRLNFPSNQEGLRRLLAVLK